MYPDFRAHQGRHSIHDSRQEAWARLAFGPTSPQPAPRAHRGMLPDVYAPDPPRRRSLRAWLRRLLLFGRDGEAGEPEDTESELAAVMSVRLKPGPGAAETTPEKRAA
jgi:hypothetical protein